MGRSGFTVLFLALFCCTVCAQEQNQRFDFDVGVGLSNGHEIEVLGFPFTDDDVNIRPEISITHVPTGLFVSLWATKSSSNEQFQQMGDDVLFSLGWVKDTRRLHIQTDLSLYDVEVIGEKKKVGSARFFIGSRRERFGPYLWFQDYGSILAYKAGLNFNRWVSVEVGGNSGISIFDEASAAFSRLKVRTPEIRWLGKAVATVTFQRAHDLPFENHTWVDLYWKII